MATQDGLLKFKGQMGDISFYKTRNGDYAARRKGGIDANRLKTDPAFARTRENGLEFSRAGTSAKLLRTALRTYVESVKDNRVSSRLTKEMMRVVRADVTSLRGQRNVMSGDVSILKGFEFNENGKVAATFFAPYQASIDRVTGTISVQIPPFISADQLAMPSGATHFKLILVGAEVNFDNNTFVVDSQESALVAVGPQAEAAQTLSATITPQSTNPLFMIFGIQFSQFVNGAQYPLRNGAFNALSIIDTSKV